MFDLALALGDWDVDRMAKGMSLRLYNEWLAYFRRQPLPWKRADAHAAVMAMTVHNTIKGTFVKYPKMLRMKDFMLVFRDQRLGSRGSGNRDQKRKPQTATEIYQDLKTALALSVGKG